MNRTAKRTANRTPRPVPTPLRPGQKFRTGIQGLDEITHGGLPRGRATLLQGGPGSGKTLLALEAVVHGARNGEPGIFVAFEEDPARIVSNVESFGWDIGALSPKMLAFVDARPAPDLIRSGEFDLVGLLAVLEAKAKKMKAKRIVFDSIDMVLALLPDELAARREVLRIYDWLVDHNFSTFITAKVGEGAGPATVTLDADFLQYMADCAISLEHRVSHSISYRSLRVLKYRSSAFSENEAPFIISNTGFVVAGLAGEPILTATTERISSGIERLDTMLGGGYFRGAGILVTGAPGTAKSTLAGAFAEAACRRGERTLYVSFDSEPGEIVRNLASVNVNVARHVSRGMLHLISERNTEGSAQVHFLRIRALAQRHKIRNLIVDPISALGKQMAGSGGLSVIERLTQWAKASRLTVFYTSLTDSPTPEIEGTQVQISTIADSWIHLSYRVQAGERNRALTIIKSRGTQHSNQVRELLLSDDGITLADVFSAGGEVLMGTLRWEREQALHADEQLRRLDAIRQRDKLAHDEAELGGKLLVLREELAAKRAERVRSQKAVAEVLATSSRLRKGTRTRRHADARPNAKPTRQ